MSHCGGQVGTLRVTVSNCDERTNLDIGCVELVVPNSQVRVLAQHTVEFQHQTLLRYDEAGKWKLSQPGTGVGGGVRLGPVACGHLPLSGEAVA
jgi:hypothetical protein